MISVMRSLLAYGMCCCIVEIARRKVFPCNVCTADVQRSNTFSPKDALSYHVKGSRNVLICPRCADAATDWCKTAIFCKKSATNLGESWRFFGGTAGSVFGKNWNHSKQENKSLGIEGLHVKKQNWCRGMEMMQTDIQNQTEEEKNP